MKIYTGYFAYTKKYIEQGLFTISIARYNPKWYEGYSEPYLAPSVDLLRRYKSGLVTEKEFEEEYIRDLDNYILHFLLMNYPQAFKPKTEIIFLCYEKPTDFCHRHILAKYITENYNYEVTEYDIHRKL